MNSSESTGPFGQIPVVEGAAATPLWTTEKVSEYLQISVKTVFNLRKRGLPYIQLGGAVRFSPQEIKDFLATHRGLSRHQLRQTVRKGPPN